VKIFYIVLLLLGLSEFISAADNNSGKHFILSSAFGYISETVIHENADLSNHEKILYGTALGSLPGFAKEITDSKFDSEDMAFNVLGSFAGSFLSNYLNNDVFVSIDHNSENKSTKIVAHYKFK